MDIAVKTKDLWRQPQLSNQTKLLLIRFGHHKITLALGHCQTDKQKEVHHESVQSRKNLARLSSNPF